MGPWVRGGEGAHLWQVVTGARRDLCSPPYSHPLYPPSFVMAPSAVPTGGRGIFAAGAVGLLGLLGRMVGAGGGRPQTAQQ